ncbi:tyrosine-type recombinase/integrase [Pseudarthrobacter sp. NPDC058362]|uniref:tyrosine-type recombinase/integrase n=1 Tax=Pseudarthrobacter sp. NPDC058362 TaxID=3346458 RepID=UPI00366842B3
MGYLFERSHVSSLSAVKFRLSVEELDGRIDTAFWSPRESSSMICDRACDPKGFYRYSFKPAAKALRMPTLKFHELRHTFASLMAGYGLSMFELSRLMGHGSITVTDGVYAHLYKKDYSELRARITTAARQATGVA